MFEFDTQERMDSKAGRAIANLISVSFAGILTAGAAVPVAPHIAKILVSGEGLAGATIKTELGRRVGAAAADATVQCIGMHIDKSVKFNLGGTFGSIITGNPFGTAAWTTVGQAFNGEIKSESELLFKFTINSGGNILGDYLSKGMILNSSYSAAKSASSNTKYSLLGNLGGNLGGFLAEGYRNLSTQSNSNSTNTQDVKKP